MIKKHTWILLAVFVVVLGAAVLLEEYPDLLGQAETPTPGPTSPAAVLEGWTSSDIASIEIVDDQGISLRVIQDSPGQWVLDTEIRETVDAGTVEEVRTQLAAARAMLYLDPGYDLEAVGLNAPSHTLTIRSEQGRESVIHIGQPTPTQNGYYVRVDNAAPAVVNKFAIDDILSKLQRDQLVSLETFPTPEP